MQQHRRQSLACSTALHVKAVTGNRMLQWVCSVCQLLIAAQGGLTTPRTTNLPQSVCVMCYATCCHTLSAS